MKALDIYSTFNDFYSGLYNLGPYVDYDKLVDFHDYMMENVPFYKLIASDFAEFRRDSLSSDRECAAFVLLLSSLGIVNSDSFQYPHRIDGKQGRRMVDAIERRRYSFKGGETV